KLDVVRTELNDSKAEVGVLRRTLAEAELCYAKQEHDMINIWNEMVEGHFDLPDNVVRNLNLVKEAANNFTSLQQAFEQKQRDLEKSRARVYHGRLRRKTGVTDGMMHGRSLSESIMEEKGNEEDLSKNYQIRENRKPVERFGVAMDLDSVFSDEKGEDMSTADSDLSYHPTPQKITRKRQSSLANVPGRRDTFVLNEAPLKKIDMDQEPKNEPIPSCSTESDFNPNATYTVEQCSGLDHRSIITRDLFKKL
ncbi:hypothetical protein WUBG_09583, partial [Wuchereria bancrofti]